MHYGIACAVLIQFEDRAIVGRAPFSRRSVQRPVAGFPQRSCGTARITTKYTEMVQHRVVATISAQPVNDPTASTATGVRRPIQRAVTPLDQAGLCILSISAAVAETAQDCKTAAITVQFENSCIT